jgi:hypothetical protein
MTMPPPDSEGSDYEVGYGKPPVAHQFKPGASGNPKGRVKSKPSDRAILMEEAAKLVTAKQGDKVLKISKDRAIIRGLIHKALNGDIQAIKLYFALKQTHEDPTISDNGSIHPDDLKMIEGIVEWEKLVAKGTEDDVPE